MPLDIDEVPDGATLRVRALPGASREGLRGVHDGALKVAVQAPPEKGKANRRIGELIAQSIGLPARRVILVSGDTSRDKKFRVADVTAAQLRQLLAQAIEPSV